jgi:hypothetical protein
VADLEVDLDALSQVSYELATIRGDLDDVHPMLDAGTDGAGSDVVGDGLGSWGHDWVDGRRTITSEIAALDQALAGVAEAFLATEQQLAAAAPRPDPSSSDR